MTIYEIKRLTEETAPYFFTRQTLKFFGQTLKDFSVTKQVDGRYMIIAIMRNAPSKMHTVRFFNPITNKLEFE
jgi:hypothetical protein